MTYLGDTYCDCYPGYTGNKCERFVCHYMCNYFITQNSMQRNLHSLVWFSCYIISVSSCISYCSHGSCLNKNRKKILLLISYTKGLFINRFIHLTLQHMLKGILSAISRSDQKKILFSLIKSWIFFVCMFEERIFLWHFTKPHNSVSTAPAKWSCQFILAAMNVIFVEFVNVSTSSHSTRLWWSGVIELHL